MNAFTQFACYLAVLLFAFFVSLRDYRNLEPSLKVISLLLGFTFFSELAAGYMSRYYGNNMMIYHFYTPVSLALTAMYYNYAIPLFRRYKVGYYVSGLGLLAAVLNTIFFQPLNTLDSNCMLFSGVCITGMALFKFYRLYLDDSLISITGNIHFWLSFIFLLFWSCTFLIWALMRVLVLMKRADVIKEVYLAIWVVNVLMYAGMGLLFCLPVTKRSLHGQ